MKVFDNLYRLKRAFAYWFVYMICRHSRGRVLPWYLKIFKSILFPLEAYDQWRGFNNQTGYDFYSDILTINGIRYDRNIFYTFKKGKVFRIIEIEDRVITVEDLTGKV